MASLHIVTDNALAMSDKLVRFSGRVTDSEGAPVVGAEIIAYRNGSKTVVASSGTSVADGLFSVEANGNHNDFFRLVGSYEGEGSAIYDTVIGIDV